MNQLKQKIILKNFPNQEFDNFTFEIDMLQYSKNKQHIYQSLLIIYFFFFLRNKQTKNHIAIPCFKKNIKTSEVSQS